MKQILTLIFCTISCFCFAQTYTISGKIADKNTKETIPYATVIIKSKTNNKTITGGITDDKGTFEISKIPVNDFFVEVQFIGYKTITKEVKNNKRKTNLGTLFIEESAQVLDEVSIVAERSTIEQKIDRKVINVGKDLTTAGATASDIMGNIPSVSVNQDGEIALRGNENVRVLIDGKPTNIEASQLLQQIPSASIKKIELITSPSAKYNPEGMSGIINIVLHKNAKLGFNGNINLGLTQGEKTRFNGSLGLNYRTGKFNIYGNYGNSFGKNTLKGSVVRFIENSAQHQDNVVDNTSHLYKIGVDYFINDKNTMSFYTNQNVFKSDFMSDIDVTYTNNPSNNFFQDYTFNKNNTSKTYNFDFKHDFDKDGHNIELEVDYNDYEGDNITDFTFAGNTSNTDYRDIILDNRKNTTINLDYVNPLSETSTLEIGLESRFRRTDNSYQTTSTTLNNSMFTYDRDIYSFYTTFKQNFDKWTYQIGARLEDYKVNSQFIETNQNRNVFEDKLFNIYPSAFVKYTPDEEKKNSYQLSISRRVDRPGLNQVNPIRAWNTSQIIAIGNMRLNPQFTNSIEFNYTRKLEKGSLTLGTFYRRIKDEINRIGYFDSNDPTKLVLDYDNFDDNNAYGFELAANYKPLSWWNFNTSFDIFSRKQKGDIENEQVEVTNTATNFRMNHNFKATKDLTFQLFGIYSGKQKILQYELKDNYYINAGARYNFAQGKGTLSLNFNDIFRTQRFAFESYRTVFQRGDLRRDSRTVYFGLSYRFGGGKNKALKRKKRDNNEKRGGFL
ncbi:TonB-dependent receptor [Tenacibaculum holothuriorum]|uniref:TonB-dependent receptor n=1 Tax=Tenacibaculum holothuriorum TaxID=1635173 RepID=A0A1Y2P9C4_9FLAO|nr:TonB-dependent receptor [Tenacibaculum holothuriorum]OSY87043.1 TonB-dependent receptor [Tenacibaculum holothuriorum]